MAKQNPQTATAPRQSPPAEGNELLLILDKEKSIIEALEKADKKGKYKTLPLDGKNNDRFLRINGSQNWFEAFGSNFWQQFKDPTRLGLIKIRDTEINSPLVKQAIRDIKDGRLTKAVSEFIEKYELSARDI